MKVIVLIIKVLWFTSYLYVEGSVLSVVQQNGDEAINGSSIEIVCITDGSSSVYDWYAIQHSSVSTTDTPISTCVLGNVCAPSTQGSYVFSVTGNTASVQIPVLRIVDEQYWFCVSSQDASNFKDFFLEVKVPITAISMDTSGNVTVVESSDQGISCTTYYGRPAADITFIKVINGITTELQNPVITYNQSGNHFTTGGLTFQPTINDTGATLYCQANNTLTQGTATSSNTLFLTVLESITTTTTTHKITSAATPAVDRQRGTVRRR